MRTDELTSQQAADRLGVSRPFLVKQNITHRVIGNRRRYMTADVDSFGATMERTKDKGAS